MKRKILMTLSLLAGIAAGARAQQTAVTAREGTLELPTYVLNAAETAPIFERDCPTSGAPLGLSPMRSTTT